MSQTDNVKVRITVSERITYNCIKEIPRAEFEKLDKALDSPERQTREKASDKILDYMNKNDDWFDAGDVEVDEFELEVGAEVSHG